MNEDDKPKTRTYETDPKKFIAKVIDALNEQIGRMNQQKKQVQEQLKHITEATNDVVIQMRMFRKIHSMLD